MHHYEVMHDFQKHLQKLYEMHECSYAKLQNKKFKETKLKVFVPLLRGCKIDKILVLQTKAYSQAHNGSPLEGRSEDRSDSCHVFVFLLEIRQKKNTAVKGRLIS